MWVLVLLYLSALLWQAWDVGLTFDEPFHLMAGYTYWLGQDVLKPATTLPVCQILGGWAPLALGVPVRNDDPAADYQDAYAISWQTFHPLETGFSRRLFFVARLPFIILPLLIAGFVWRWSRELYGPSIAAVLAVVVLLEPNLLAHGPLINADVAATFGLLWVSYACWRFWRRPARGELLHLGASLAFALLTKFTLLVAVPFVTAVVLTRHLIDRHWKSALAALAVVAAIAYLGLIAGYQFDVHSTDGAEFEHIYLDKQFADWEIALWRFVPLPMPLQFVDGVHFVIQQGIERGQPGFLLGRPADPPEPLYFPLVLAIKYPIALQLLLVASLGLLMQRLWRRQADAADFFVWAPVALVFGLAVQSHMLEGLRYILPAIPLMILGGGYLLQSIWERRVGRTVTIAGVAWLSVASASIYPHGLAYFNEWIGGPDRGWHYLADSNIDWGQDLGRVWRYADKHDIRKIKLAYFGRDDLERYFGPGRIDLVPHPFCSSCVDGRIFKPEPGVYAISVNMLLGFYWPPEYRDYFRYFREREPDAKAGYSIFIYHVEEPTEGEASAQSRQAAFTYK